MRFDERPLSVGSVARRRSRKPSFVADELGRWDVEPTRGCCQDAQLRVDLPGPRCRADRPSLPPRKRAGGYLHRCCPRGRDCALGFAASCPGVGIRPPQFATSSGACVCPDRRRLRGLRGCASRGQTWRHLDPGGYRVVGGAHSARLRGSASLLTRSVRVCRLRPPLGLPPRKPLRPDPLRGTARPLLPLQPLDPSPLSLWSRLHRDIRGAGLGFPIGRCNRHRIQGARWVVLDCHRGLGGKARSTTGSDPGLLRSRRDRPQSVGDHPYRRRRTRRRAIGACRHCGPHGVVRRSASAGHRVPDPRDAGEDRGGDPVHHLPGRVDSRTCRRLRIG